MAVFSGFENLDFIKSFFILLLAVTGGYIGETTSCQTRKLLNNMFAKDVLVFVLLYFGLDLMDTKDMSHPLQRLKQTFFIWGFYTMFTRMTIFPTILAFLLLCIYYINLDLIGYYEIKKDKDEQYIEQIKYINKIVIISILSVVVSGFLYYIFKQKRDHGKRFSFIKFLKGVRKCKHD